MQRAPHEVRLSDYKIPEFLIDKVNLTFDLGEQDTHVLSCLEMVRNPQSKDKTVNLTLDGEELSLVLLKLDGIGLAPSQYQITETGLTIFNVPDKFTLETQVKIHPSTNTELMGLYVSKGNFVTHCEAEGFRRITFFLDRPDVMSIYTTTIIGDAKTLPTMLSNGNLVGTGTFTTGRHWITWEDPFRKPSYLFALVAGDFELLQESYLTQSGKEVSLEIYSEQGYGKRLTHAMDSLKKALRWDEQHYGRECDLQSYKIVAVADFNMGAMENKGLNIFNASALLASAESVTDENFRRIEAIIAHEEFHNYTGNRVGPRDWFQLTVKEGLTTKREQEFEEHHHSVAARIAQVNFLRNYQFAEDAGPLAHPVQPKSYQAIDNFYTATVYEKGAEIFNMMQTILGKSLFRKGMDIYFEENDGKSVTIEDFVRAMEKASGRDLSQFMLWFHQVGTPTIDITDQYNATTKQYSLTFKQSGAQPLMVPIRMGFLFTDGKIMPLRLKGSNEATNETVLVLTEASSTYVFDHVYSHPLPSLLRNFSAPVIINYEYSNEDLRSLARHDSDPFNRWEASQRYVMRLLLKLIKVYQSTGSIIVPSKFTDYFHDLLVDDTADLSLLPFMLTIPEEFEIAKAMSVVDVSAICAVRNQVIEKIVEKVGLRFLERYFVCNKKNDYTDKYDEVAAVNRQLKSVCLSYLPATNTPDMNALALIQFYAAQFRNMTDTFAALKVLANNDCKYRDVVLAAFYKQWKNDSVVITKWFAIQAGAKSPSTLQRIKSVIIDDAFNMLNPTHVRALIRPFILNFYCFHAASGEGYAFLTDLILKLDKQNANLAADFTDSYAQWRKFASPQRELMQSQLRRIVRQDGISKNLYEIASKCLGEELVLLPVGTRVTNVVESLFSRATEGEVQEVAGIKLAL